MKELLKRVWTDPRVALAVLLPLLSAIGSIVVALAKDEPSLETVAMAFQQWCISLVGVRAALFADSPNAQPPEEKQS